MAKDGETLLRRMRGHQAMIVQLRAEKAELLAAYAVWMRIYEASPSKDPKLWKALWDAFNALDSPPPTRAQRRKEKADKLKEKRPWAKILAGDEVFRTLICFVLVWLVWRIGVESR